MAVQLAVEDFNIAFTPGYHYHFAKVEDELRWEEWYNTRYNSLLPTPTVDNGLALIGGNPLRLPVFKMVSDFMSNAALSAMPGFASPDPALQDWLNDNSWQLDKALRRATRHWSVTDLAVLVSYPDRVEAFDPRYYFRCGSPDQPDALVGHILAIPFLQRDAASQLNPYTILPPNRIKVVRLRNGAATTQLFSYSGSEASGVVGQPLTELTAGPETAICVAGSWDSWYAGIRDVAAALLIAYSLHNVQLNRYANRPSYIPVTVLDGIRDSHPDPAAMNPTAIMKAFNELIRPAIGLMQDAEPPMESVYNEDFQSREIYLGRLWEAFFLGSGLPPSSFGIGVSVNESGYAREKAQDAASARIRAFRQDLTECLPQLVKGMGAPEGEVTFSWAAPPFQNRSQHVEEILGLFDRQLISPAEARRELGWGDMPTEDMLPAPAANAGALPQGSTAEQQEQNR